MSAPDPARASFSTSEGIHPRHASKEEYAAFLRRRVLVGEISMHHERACLQWYGRFVRHYPNLEDWFKAPLAERVGRLYGEECTRPSFPVSYKARSYLFFLAFCGYARFDWEWILGVPLLSIWKQIGSAGPGTTLIAGIEALADEAEKLGYDRTSSARALRGTIGCIFLRTTDPHVEHIGDAHIEELEAALRAFAERPDVALFYGSEARYARAMRARLERLYSVRVVLYHRGQTSVLPSKGVPRAERPSLKPRMEKVVERYLAARNLTHRPRTVNGLGRALRFFIAWLVEAYPDLETFAEVRREHVLEYAEALKETRSLVTKRPLAPRTRDGRLSALSVFFRDTAEWGWEEVPGRPLLSARDLPRRAQRVPRYIPEEELSRLMEAIRSLECPYQRAALLVARWSGARRDEIRRLEVDCLDSYPDGTPRLRIPAGKTHQERTVPLGEEAAEAIRALQMARRDDHARSFRDELTGTPTHYLFVHRGKMLCSDYLFYAPLQKVCANAGLLTPDGKPKVTPHRFRHTVGTQLAEKGARLSTIMKVLGHQSASMSMVYAQISDKEVLKDYEAVLGPGAAVAGALAETLRSGELPASDVEWIKQNFFKTELELGHCLRLPQEGPCECDLYLSCAKFVTTSEYAPRLRARRLREFELIEDAVSNGWEREVERHRCTVRRIEQLLIELDKSLEAKDDAG